LAAIRHPGSCNGGRNALGIDISAVHNAVLRGNLAKLPEPFVNEHPVTIYPGPSSKAAGGEGARSKRLLSSVEKHKEVCHMLNPHSSSSTSSSGSQHTSSGEASPAASHINVASSKQASRDEDYSEDSLEESTISTDLTPVKQNGVAWEIHFKSNKKKSNGTKKSSGASKKVSIMEFLIILYYFDIYPLYPANRRATTWTTSTTALYTTNRACWARAPSLFGVPQPKNRLVPQMSFVYPNRRVPRWPRDRDLDLAVKWAPERSVMSSTPATASRAMPRHCLHRRPPPPR